MLQLERRGQKCIALTLSGNSSETLTAENIRCDISNPAELEKLSLTLPQPRAIVHCASSNRGGPDAYRKVYLRGVENLVKHFPHSPLFFTSSTSVYAQNDGSRVDEDCPAEPERESSQILREAEDITLAHQGTVLRLSGIYGPGRSFYLRSLLDHSARLEPADKPRYLNQIHRDDAAAAIDHLIQQPSPVVSGQIYNVTDDHSPTQRECYQSLAAFLHRPSPPENLSVNKSKRSRKHRRISNKKLGGTGWQTIYPSLLDALKNDPAFIPSFIPPSDGN